MEQFKVSRALGLSFKSWFRNFIPFTLLAAVLYAPVLIWVATVDVGGDADTESVVRTLFTYPVWATAAISTLVPPLLTYRVIQELNGTKVSMWTSIRFGLRGLVPAIMFAVALFILELLPFVGSVVGLILSCVYFVVTPAAVAERCGAFDAFSRSAELTRGRRWGIFGLLLLLGLIMGAALFIWVFPMLQGDSSAMSSRTSAIVFTIVLGTSKMLVGIAEAVSYALLRQDKDGVSHAELARIFD